MKISELVALLTGLQQEHGDLEVRMYGGCGCCMEALEKENLDVGVTSQSWPSDKITLNIG